MKIKQLVWQKNNKAKFYSNLKLSLGKFNSKSYFSLFLIIGQEYPVFIGDMKENLTLDEAKAYAQQWYEDLIRSGIDE